MILLESIEERLGRRGLVLVFSRRLRPRPGAPESVQHGLVVVFCEPQREHLRMRAPWRRPFFTDLLDHAADRRELGALVDREIRWSLTRPGMLQGRSAIPEVAVGDPDTTLVDQDIAAALLRSLPQRSTR